MRVPKKSGFLRMGVVCLAVSCLGLLVGCGGGESADDLEIDFNVSSVETLGEAEVVDMTRDQLATVGFLSDWLTLVEAFKTHGEVMETLGTVGPESVDLGWVRRVHDASERAEVFHTEGLRLTLPEGAPPDYERILGVYIAGVESFGFASTRLLEAALTIGPTGREFDDMEPLEQLAFRSSLHQFAIYKADMQLLMERTEELLEPVMADARVSVPGF